MATVISAVFVLAYILLGGLRATMYNEVLQFALIVIGFAPLAWYSVLYCWGKQGHIWAGMRAVDPHEATMDGWGSSWSRLRIELRLLVYRFCVDSTRAGCARSPYRVRHPVGGGCGEASSLCWWSFLEWLRPRFFPLASPAASTWRCRRCWSAIILTDCWGWVLPRCWPASCREWRAIFPHSTRFGPTICTRPTWPRGAVMPTTSGLDVRNRGCYSAQHRDLVRGFALQ